MHAATPTHGPRHRPLRMAAWAGIMLLLALPGVAMQFTDEVAWRLTDFAVAAVLLGGAGLAFEAILQAPLRTTAYRLAFGIVLVSTVLLVWVIGAVGIVASAGDAADLPFAAVLAVLITGTALSRLRPRPMSRVLLATAVVHTLVALFAVAAGWGAHGPAWPQDLLLASAVFVSSWLAAAALFAQAARGANPRRARSANA